jgi:glycosyltransferase 2 family protein
MAKRTIHAGDLGEIRVKLALRLIIAAAGLALFGWFVHRIGADTISRAFATLGWSAPLILLPYALVYLFDTLGWRLCFRRALPKAITFGTLFRIRWAGESLNNVVPSAYLGGEAVKVYLLRKLGLPVADGAESVIIGKTAQVLSEVIFIALGAVAGSAILPSNSSARAGMFAIAGAATAVVAMLFWLQHRGIFSTLLALTARLRLRIRALASRAESLRQLDKRIFDFYRIDQRRFIFCVTLYLAGWIADSLEVLLVSHLLGMPLNWSQALAFEAFISVAKALGVFAPAALGVQESGVIFLFYLFGLPPALGVSYAVIRRARELTFVLIGGALLYAEEPAMRGLAKRVAREAEAQA